MLILENVSVKRGSFTVAENFTLRLGRGKVYTVLGPNGTGKSSLLKTLFGEVAHRGSIRYNGEPLSKTNLQSWRKRIGYMPQDTFAEASLTALEVVLLGRMDGLGLHVGDELLNEAAAVMEMLGIAHLAHRDVMRLSGGQRQLVMFAQVMMRRPEILLLDEPVSALDMHHQINLLERVAAYTRGQNLTTVMVLHDLSLAAQFSDGLILIGGGKVHAEGAPKDVLQPDLIGALYQVDVELLYDRFGAPVIRPLRHRPSESGQTFTA
ncbi:ABC transporter ATP-binding protein [Neisseria sp. CCUG12390]|uniref:ABC transporter ATP-binding protein n=1 Tax=Neisseria sp. CCUG12390 TaxID=3392035 RepID=UPI003A0FBC5B